MPPPPSTQAAAPLAAACVACALVAAALITTWRRHVVVHLLVHEPERDGLVANQRLVVALRVADARLGVAPAGSMGGARETVVSCNQPASQPREEGHVVVPGQLSACGELWGGSCVFVCCNQLVSGVQGRVLLLPGCGCRRRSTQHQGSAKARHAASCARSRRRPGVASRLAGVRRHQARAGCMSAADRRSTHGRHTNTHSLLQMQPAQPRLAHTWIDQTPPAASICRTARNNSNSNATRLDADAVGCISSRLPH